MGTPVISRENGEFSQIKHPQRGREGYTE